jgi:hypothetical protein
MSSSAEATGRIVRTEKDGMAILWTYVPEMPNEFDRRSRPWLAVLSWSYNGSMNNGMPDVSTNEAMLALDEALGTIEKANFCGEAYRRVGYNLREFVFYVAERESFMGALNEVLADQPRYPLEIKFYEDGDWSDFRKLIEDFSDA